MPKFEYTQNLAFLNTYQKLNMRAKSLNVTMFDSPPKYLTPENPTKPFNISLNQTKMKKHIETLKELALNYELSLDKEEIENKSQINEIIDDYIEEASNMSIEQTKAAIGCTIMTVILLVIYVIWLTIKYKKVYKMIMVLSLGVPIPMAKGEVLEGVSECYVCQATWLSILLTTLSIFGVVLYLCKSCKDQSFCKGHIFSKTMNFYLVLSEGIRYVPIKLRQLPGHLHKLTMINNVHPLNIEIEKGYLWDTICINWDEVMITYNGDEIVMPSRLLVPIIDKN